MCKILIVDDDKAIRWSLKTALETKYIVLESADAETALSILVKDKVDLCLIDVNLPSCDGFELCRRIRMDNLMPIIFITVNDDEESLTQGLMCGGDDYVTKPFSFRELELRIMAHLRRFRYQQEDAKKRLVRGKYVLNLEQHTLMKDGELIDITKTEFNLLRRFMLHSGCLVTREQLLREIWDVHENFVEDNTLTVNISRIRKKLAYKDGECPIETVSGIGYRWKE